MKEFAKAAEEKADWDRKLKKQNPFDGLIHNDDGSRQFTDETRSIVGGVNNYVKTHSHKRNSKKSQNENHLYVPKKHKSHLSHAHVSRDHGHLSGV